MSSAPARPRQPRQKAAATAGGPGRTTFTFTIDGTTHTVDAMEISALDELELTRVTGLTVVELVAGGDVSLVAVGALVWLARRQAGEQVALVDVLAATNLATLEGLDYAAPETPPPARPTGRAAS
jgi:hypothetical protein